MLGRRVVVVVAALIAAALCLASYGSALAGQRPATLAGRGPAGVAGSGTVRGGWLAARSTGTAEYGPVSCAPGAAGLCTMVGANTGGDGIHALVATAKAGVLGPAKQIPGTVALSTGSDGVFVTADTLSCPAAGDCLAAGSYFDKSNFMQVYVAGEVKGAWHKAVPVPGLAKLNTGGNATVLSAFCPSPGNCAITGMYTPGKARSLADLSQAFVASEVAGVWHPATAVPGIGKLNTGDSAVGTVISCAAPGYCALGGSYQATSGGYDLPFIDSEVNGTWGAAEAVPGRPVTRGNYGITAISCPGAGDCVAAGNDNNGSYTITQQGSGWSKAAVVSGLGWVEALSCPAVGRCVAGGATSFGYGGFAATTTERGGTWGKADLVPGAKAFTYKGKHATSSEIQGLSCPAAGYCVAGGDFFVSVNDSAAYSRGLIVSETAGAWGTARIPPGLAGLDSAVSSEVMYVACAAPATCVAIGIYDPSEYREDGFFSAELPRQPTRTALRLSLAHVIPGKEQAAKITVSVTAHGSTPGAVPAGKVTVRAGSKTVCVIKLTAGAGKAAGGCRLTPRELKPGTYRVAATYPGSGPFESSASAASVLTVA
jgi:hypothetical protein